MEQRSYKGVERKDLDRIRTELAKFGIKMPDGDNVEVKGPLGVKMQVDYDEPQKTLSLTIVNKPAFVTENQIWKVVEMSAGKVGR
ncbi:MAG: hypothetical protein ACK4S4_09485 [Pyrinomonadaceae bacterium]